MCFAKTTYKWTEEDATEYVRGYTHDAKQQWIRQEDYDRLVKRLLSDTGWTAKRVKAWMAGSRFKACKSNPVLGTKRAREEAKLIEQGGSEGHRVEALQAVRAALTDRVAKSAEMVVTAAMVQELEDNRRAVCGKDRRTVTAAILIAAAEMGMRVEVFDGGARGRAGDRVAEAHQWAVEAGWVQKAAATATLAQWRDLAIRRGPGAQTIMIEMGVGWEGATEGFKKVFDRVVGIDNRRHRIGDKGWTQPDFLREFQDANEWEGGMVLGMASRARARKGDRLSSFGSIDCTEESLAQALNYGKAHGKGYYAGKPRSVWAQGGLDAVIRGVREARAQDPFHQFALENPAYSALRKDGQMIKYFGEGIVVQGCAYGGRLTGKGYRFWMSPETLEVFLERQILPKAKASKCKECKAGRKHRQAACPQKGDDRERESIAGETKKATKNRIPVLLAEMIGGCMIEGRRRAESRAHGKRKRS